MPASGLKPLAMGTKAAYAAGPQQPAQAGFGMCAEGFSPAGTS